MYFMMNGCANGISDIPRVNDIQSMLGPKTTRTLGVALQRLARVAMKSYMNLMDDSIDSYVQRSRSGAGPLLERSGSEIRSTTSLSAEDMGDYIEKL